MTRDMRAGLIYATLGVIFFSTSPILVRLAEPLTAYQISAGRLLVGSWAILLLARWRGEKVHLERRDWGWFLVIGGITAAHFYFYVASLSHTTIAHSLTIVYSAPLFVALLSRIVLNETLRLKQYAGMCIVVIGLGVLVGFEPNMTREMLLGDLFALGSAVTFALYSIAGRSRRERFPLFTYAGIVYGLGALFLLPFAIATTSSWPSWGNFGAVLGLGLIPMAAGHTLYNAAVRKTHAAYANLIATQEVTGGVLLGVIVLHELPSPTSILGLLITLLGIGIVLLARK